MTFFDIRRRMLEGAFGVRLSYTGTYDLFGNSSQGFAVLKTSGTLSISGEVDLCLVGDGGKGARGYVKGSGTSAVRKGGGGGAGGFVSNYTKQKLKGNFAVTIGAGASSSANGGQTSMGTLYTANGGTTNNSVRYSVTGRGTSGAGNPSGTSGEDGVFPWDDAVNFADFQVSGCGGGASTMRYDGESGGAGGGGKGGGNENDWTSGSSGTANTGGGGGGGSSGRDKDDRCNGGNGGSGVVFICWGYKHTA